MIFENNFHLITYANQSLQTKIRILQSFLIWPWLNETNISVHDIICFNSQVPSTGLQQALLPLHQESPQSPLPLDITQDQGQGIKFNILGN